MTPNNLDHIPDRRDREDIVDLARKITEFRKGAIDEERFKHFRLTRGVYGQRQIGVQMFRTKLPLGRLTAEQLIRLADISEKYATGNLHLTTRQNIQFHYVKLENSVPIWQEMAEVGLNAREACGNTVRNVTASATAGIDPHEAFDVSPYANALYRHFLRNPICQEMGRKVKIAFSSSDRDTAYTYFHDFGFIPRVEGGKRGFKVVVGGGLGAQSIIAQTAFEFLEEDCFLPFVEAAIRVFDRYGEREKRFKARLKFLVQSLGLEQFLSLVNEEITAVPEKSIRVTHEDWQEAPAPSFDPDWQAESIEDPAVFQNWKTANTFRQKDGVDLAVAIKVRLGDLPAEQARLFAAVVKAYAADDIRITVNQGFLLRHVHPGAVAPLYNALRRIGLADVGFASIADVTACPGTDTCNLGVTNSTALARELEQVAAVEYPGLLLEKDIQIKISGCMNSCGQHMAAQIGFHGSSMKVAGKVAPAMQVVLGGGLEPDGVTFIGEKVIKLPTKRIPDTLRLLLDDFQRDRTDGDTFNTYYYRHGKAYFYALLKPLAETDTLTASDFQDWGRPETYVQAIGVGECAGAVLDVVATILNDAHTRLADAEKYLGEANWAGAIYSGYSAMVIAAKALLLAADVRCNTHLKIIEDFQAHYVETGQFSATADFPALTAAVRNNEPSEDFARDYVAVAVAYCAEAIRLRSAQVAGVGKDKEVITDFYKA